MCILCVYCLQVVLVYNIQYVRASGLLTSVVACAAQITEGAGPLPCAFYVQWVKKLSQCLAVLKRLTCRKTSKLCNNLKIIYVIA